MCAGAGRKEGIVMPVTARIGLGIKSSALVTAFILAEGIHAHTSVVIQQLCFFDRSLSQPARLQPCSKNSHSGQSNAYELGLV